MRTTIDLPDELYRQIKARAALRGLKLKEYVTAALRESLLDSRPPGEVRETGLGYATEVSDLGAGCVLPRIEGETSELMRSITERGTDEILETEEGDGALLPGRRQSVAGDDRR